MWIQEKIKQFACYSSDQVYFKQWGLQRSGTNYLKWLLDYNFRGVKVLANQGGWKHSVPSNQSQFRAPSMYSAAPAGIEIQANFVMFREPSQWLLSFKNYAALNPPTLPSNFPLICDWEPSKVQLVMDLWVRYNTEYINLVEGGCGFYALFYEDLMSLPEVVLEWVRKHFGLRCSAFVCPLPGIKRFLVTKRKKDPHATKASTRRIQSLREWEKDMADSITGDIYQQWRQNFRPY